MPVQSRLELNIWEAAEADDCALLHARLQEPDTFVDLECDSGSTALHVAASAGSTRVIEYLLDHGASLTLTSTFNNNGTAYSTSLPLRVHSLLRLALTTAHCSRSIAYARSSQSAGGGRQWVCVCDFIYFSDAA